ncbi:MAG: diguanylate cyclase [Dethiobacter sp.]|nr:diguanylate cyclase [Dethiobacter sp.]MBS3989044.1 diguanylate cyclase [Dethiobacter sp.]
MEIVKDKQILVVDDSKFLAQTTADALRRYGYQAEIALTGEEAVEKVCGGILSPDLVLMDIEMGVGIDGAQAAGLLLQHREIPIVFLSAYSEIEVTEKIRSVASYGYLLKGSGENVLISTIEMALRLYEVNSLANMYQQIFENSLTELYIFNLKNFKFLAVNRGARENLGYSMEELSNMTPLDLEAELDLLSLKARLEPLVCGSNEQLLFNSLHRRKNGSQYSVEIRLQLHCCRRKKICVAFVIDQTDRIALEEELWLLAVTDTLTNVYNRRYFTQKLEEEIERVRRSGISFSLIMLDIDHFKNVNDLFGHNAGDLVLKNMAKMILNRIRKIDTMARWGGEEFVLLLPETDGNAAVALAETLRRQLSQMEIPGVGKITVSFGVASYSPGDTVDTLVNRADKRMYEAKFAGRNCVR